MDLLLQLMANGLALGAAYALVALGLALIWSVTRVFHLAHGGVYVIAGYLFYAATAQAEFSTAAGLAVAVAGASLLGLAIDMAIYRPLVARGARPLTLTVASLATLIFLLNLAAAIWGTETRQIGNGDPVSGFVLGPVYMAGTGVAMIAAGVVLFGICLLLLHYSRMGRTLRAVADNPEMARVVGVNLTAVRAAAYFIGSALVVPAAYLIGLQTGIGPYTGMSAILLASASVIVGGIGSIGGAALGAVVLAVAQNVGIWQIDSAWQESIAFGVLLVVIVLRPTGFLGARGRAGGV